MQTVIKAPLHLLQKKEIIIVKKKKKSTFNGLPFSFLLSHVFSSYKSTVQLQVPNIPNIQHFLLKYKYC